MGWDNDPLIEEDEKDWGKDDPIIKVRAQAIAPDAGDLLSARMMSRQGYEPVPDVTPPPNIPEQFAARMKFREEHPEAAYPESDQKIKKSLMRKYPREYKEEIQKENMLSFARERLEGYSFPNTVAAGVGMVSAMSGPLARVFDSEAADYGERLAGAFEQAAEEQAKGGVVPPAVKRAYRGVLKSSAPLIAGGPVMGPGGMIAAAAAQETNSALAEGRDAGLSGAELGRYALTQGAIEAAPAAIFQKIGLGGLEKIAGGRSAAQAGVWNMMKRLGLDAIPEFPEELITEFGHNLSKATSGVDPNATSLESIAQTASDTTLQTLLGLGVASAPHAAQSIIDSKSAKVQQDIARLAEVGEPPSRSKWKEWGMSPKEGKSSGVRLAFIQNWAKEKVAAMAEPKTPDPVFESTEEMAKAYLTATKEEEGKPWYKKIKEARDSGQTFDQIFPEALADQVRRGLGPKATDWHKLPEGTPVTSHKAVEVIETKDGKFWRMNIPKQSATIVAQETAPTSQVASEVAPQVASEVSSVQLQAPLVDARLESLWNDSTNNARKNLTGEDVNFAKTKWGDLSSAQKDAVARNIGLLQPPWAIKREALQAAAEESGPKQKGFLKEELGAAPVGGTLGQQMRPDVVGGVDISPANPEVSRRLQSAHGVAGVSFWGKIKEAAVTLGYYTTRANVYLSSDFETAKEILRLHKAVNSYGKDEAIRTTAAVIHNLGPEQVKLFERYAVVQNQLAALDMGQPLRFGFENKEEVEAYKTKLDAIVNATPEVKAAIESRRAVTRELVGKLVSLNLLPESALANADTYYHQQVHLYQAARQKYSGGGAKLPGGKKSFQKKRTVGPESLGEEYDYNTSYIEAEVSWMADAFAAIKNHQLFTELMATYNVRDKAEAEAQRKGVSLDQYVRESGDLTYWVAPPKNVFYPAFSIPERIAEQLQSGLMKEYNITEKDVKTVIAIGGERPAYVIPKELAAQLDTMRRGEGPHWMTKMNHEIMDAWKAWTLLNPKKFVSYNIRNFLGDLDAVLGGAPGVLLHFKKAMKDIKAYYRSSLSLTPELRMARDDGVISSGFFSSDVTELGDLSVFSRLRKEKENTFRQLLHPAKTYMGVVRPWVNMREDALRYAAFLYYLDKINSGTLKHYGASKRAAIQEIQKSLGKPAAAARLARDLVGDYGNMTAAGEWNRRHLMPFWAFAEINAKRYPRMFINAYQSGGGLGRAGTAAAVHGGVTTAAVILRIGWMYGVVWAWNNLVMPALTGRDDEKELPEYERAAPHVNLGRNPDGTIRVFRGISALGDFLEWGGAGELPGMVSKYRAGQASAMDVMTEAGKAVVEKFVGYVRPDIMGGVGFMTGQTYFPSPFSPQSITRGEAASGIIGLRDEYNWIKGKMLGTGETARKNYWQRWVVGVVDPRAAALHEIHDLRNRFMESKGVTDGGVYAISEYKIPRDAVIAEDYDAFVDWKRNFQAKNLVARGGYGKERFIKALERIDPVASRLSDKDEMEFVQNYLTPEQRDRLDVARDYAANLKETMAIWWEVDDRDLNAGIANSGK